MEPAARPAATILLLRDRPGGLEVFMVVRHHAIDFAGGALVFPGGRVEEADFELAARPDDCPNPDGLDIDALAFRVAAIEQYVATNEEMPFIADDLLVDFDDTRAAAALEVISELS